MSNNDMSTEDRIEYWRMVLEDFNESGLPRTEYCEKNEIKLTTFDYWKRRINDLDATDPDGSRFAELIIDKGSDRTSYTKRDIQSSTNQFTAQMVISCGKIFLHINTETPSELISRILEILPDA